MKTNRCKIDQTETLLESFLALVAMVLLIGLSFFLLVALTQSIPEPEERCFSAATVENSYCRTQADWGN